MNKQRLLSKLNQEVLDFLCQYPSDSFYSSEIAQKTGLSKGGVNQALRFLAIEGLLKSETKGNMTFYQANLASPVVRQSKVFHSIMFIDPLVSKIKNFAQRVILFGSCAEGTDSNESDIDLLVVGNQKTEIENIVSKFKTKRKIQLILKSPQEYIILEKNEPVFFREIEKGKMLWEKI